MKVIGLKLTSRFSIMTLPKESPGWIIS